LQKVKKQKLVNYQEKHKNI